MLIVNASIEDYFGNVDYCSETSGCGYGGSDVNMSIVNGSIEDYISNIPTTTTIKSWYTPIEVNDSIDGHISNIPTTTTIKSWYTPYEVNWSIFMSIMNMGNCTSDQYVTGFGNGSKYCVGLTVDKDIVAGLGLSGGGDNVLTGSDADVTVAIDPAVVANWTGAGAKYVDVAGDTMTGDLLLGVKSLNFTNTCYSDGKIVNLNGWIVNRTDTDASASIRFYETFAPSAGNVGGGYVGIRVATSFNSSGIIFQPQGTGLNRYILQGTDTRAGYPTGLQFYSDAGKVIYPFTTNAYDLGTTSLEWNEVYTQNIVSSGDLTLNPTSGEVVTSDDVVIGGTANIGGEALTIIKSAIADFILTVKNTGNTGVSGMGMYDNNSVYKGYIGYNNADKTFNIFPEADTRVSRNMYSASNNLYDFGIATQAWRNLFLQNITFTTQPQTPVSTVTLCLNTGTGISKIVKCTASLSTLKHDIETNPFGLETVLKMRPRIYKGNSDNISHSGFIAEEIEQDAPILAQYSNGNISGVDYMGATSILTKAIQEQEAEILLLHSELCKKDNTYIFCDKEVKNVVPVKWSKVANDNQKIDQSVYVKWRTEVKIQEDKAKLYKENEEPIR
jgi:hypothetical protein